MNLSKDFKDKLALLAIEKVTGLKMKDFEKDPSKTNCRYTIAYDNDPVKGRVKTFRLLADNGAVYHETIASTLHYAIFMCVGEYCKNWLIFNNVLKKAIGARHDLPRASNARQTP